MSLSLLDSGRGIPRSVDELVDSEVEESAAPEAKFEKDADGDPLWSDKPTFMTQLMDLPDTCKPGAMQAKVFDLLDPDKLDSYNALMERSIPAEAPGIIIEQNEIHPPADGKWLAIVRYVPVLYKKLIR